MFMLRETGSEFGALAPAPTCKTTAKVRTLFLSDLHLGAAGSRADLALQLLHATPAQKYVLVGDILDLWHPGPSRWGAAEQAVVDFIYARHKAGAEIVYISGNHDNDPQASLATCLLPVGAQKQFVHITADDRQLLVVHGDRADRAWMRSLLLTHTGAWLERNLRLIDQNLRRFSSRSPKSHRSVIEGVLFAFNLLLCTLRNHESLLVELARKAGCDGVICGHFHQPALHQRDGLIYGNCGDWRDNFTALAERHDGTLSLIGGRSAMPVKVRAYGSVLEVCA